jgi:uncharacterized protein (TIGR02145 family)
MKKLLLIVALIATSFTLSAQVGIGTTTPEGALDVVSENSGIILPRVANISEVNNPVNGMMVYDIFNKCIRPYEGNNWTDCLNGAETKYFFQDVTTPTGKIWMDRNLGATQVASASNDFNAYGSLYQWGRLSDGHEIINWTSSTGSDGEEQNNETPSTTALTTPPTSQFILGTSNWYTGPNPDDLWKEDGTGVNNPCPSGYRVPTKAEWQAEVDEFTPQNAASALASPLKLPMVGYRDRSNGSFLEVGSAGYYWSSTVGSDNSKAWILDFNNNNVSFDDDPRIFGFPVRCIQD